MLSTSSILSSYETCDRKGLWSLQWAANKLRPTDMVTEVLRQALTSPEPPPYGELAGAAMLQLATDRGVDLDTPRLYPSVIHHAAIADLMVTAIRKPGDPPWKIPDENFPRWQSGCFMSPDGNFLRRVVVVSNWSDERHTSECRSWATLGEIAHYELPMQMIVLVIGQMRDGLRTSSPWASGFLHPSGNHVLRFRKKGRSQSEVFSEKWEKVYREDHAEISREKWLEAMLQDDVLREVCFREDIPIPPLPHLLRVRQMAQAKLDRLLGTKTVPEANLSGCDWPVACPFIRCCHVLPEKEPEEKYGFVRLSY